MTRSPRVLMLGFDAMDPGITTEMAARGQLPAFAGLLEGAARCPTENPFGLFVGTLWSTFFTASTAATTGFYCWEEIVPGSYEKRLTTPTSIRGIPFWETVSRAGRRVAVLDVPHSRAQAPLNGVQVSEWGCHDRHFGLRSHPPDLASEVIARFGPHPILGSDPFAVREWAPDDYLFRERGLRSGDEERQLLAGLLAGAEAKTRLSRSILDDGPWDLFVSVWAESHCSGHQSWHVRDPDHPRHDPELLRSMGDPLQQIYRRMDAALGEHLAAVDDETTVLVLLSHGMGPHYDATHLLPEILRRLDGAYSARTSRAWQGRALGSVWLAFPPRGRAAAGPLITPVLAKRAARRHLRAAEENDTEAERRRQRFFMAPNNYVFGGVRINLRGREPDGKVSPGAEFDQLCRRLAEDLLAIVNVDTGAPVVRRVERTDRYYRRDPLDALPDLLLEWNHDRPVETIWSPRFGLAHGVYSQWRSGDHRPGGMLLARGPDIVAGREHRRLAIQDLAPSIAARLGVSLPDVDGVPAAWLSGERATDPSRRAVEEPTR